MTRRIQNCRPQRINVGMAMSRPNATSAIAGMAGNVTSVGLQEWAGNQIEDHAGVGSARAWRLFIDSASLTPTSPKRRHRP